MTYLLLLAVVVFALGYASQSSALQQNKQLFYVVVSGVIIWLVMGYRGIYSGSLDTANYALIFKSISKVTDFRVRYDSIVGDNNVLFSEVGFSYFMWLVSKISDAPRFLVVVTSAIVTYCVCHFIRNNSEDPQTSFVVYICLGLFTFNMNGMRQAMAMAVCLLAYDFVKKRKLIPFVLLILLAMQFHKTAICFTIVYVLPNLKYDKKNIVVYALGLIVFLFSVDSIIGYFNEMANENYELVDPSEGGGITVIMIYAACIAMAAFVSKSLEKKEIKNAFFAVVIGGTMYITRFFSNQIMERVSYYFFYFTLLLIPGVFSVLEEQERKTVKFIFFVASIILFAYRIRFGAFRNFTIAWGI